MCTPWVMLLFSKCTYFLCRCVSTFVHASFHVSVHMSKHMSARVRTCMYTHVYTDPSRTADGRLQAPSKTFFGTETSIDTSSCAHTCQCVRPHTHPCACRTHSHVSQYCLHASAYNHFHMNMRIAEACPSFYPRVKFRSSRAP